MRKFVPASGSQFITAFGVVVVKAVKGKQVAFRDEFGSPRVLPRQQFAAYVAA